MRECFYFIFVREFANVTSEITTERINRSSNVELACDSSPQKIACQSLHCTMRAQDNSTWRFAAVVVPSEKFSPRTRRVGKSFSFPCSEQSWKIFLFREILIEKNFNNCCSLII